MWGFFSKDINCMNCEYQQRLTTLNMFKRRCNSILYSKTPMRAASWIQLYCCVLSSRLIFYSQSEWETRWTNTSAVIEDWLSLVCSTRNKRILPNELKPCITEQCRANITALSSLRTIKKENMTCSVQQEFFDFSKTMTKNSLIVKKTKSTFKYEQFHFMLAPDLYRFDGPHVQKEGSKLQSLPPVF